MVMVARYWGHDVDLNGLRERFALSLSGATLRALMTLADRLGFSSRALRVELSGLNKVRLPAVIHWDLNHFVVLKSISRRGAIVHDPSCGERALSIDELSRRFTGVALEVFPGPDFRETTAKTKTSLNSLWSRIDGLGRALAQIVVLSALLQVVVLAAPIQLQLVVDEAILRSDDELLVPLAIGFGGLVLVRAVVEALRSWMLRYCGALLTFQMVGNLVRHVLRLRASFFEKRHVGDILSRIGSTAPIQEAITNGVVVALIDGLMAAIAGVLLFVYSPLLASVVLFAFVLNIAIATALYSAIRHRTQEEIYATAKERSHLMETIRASTTIKLMGREAERESVWRNLYADVINASFSTGKYHIALAFAQTVIAGLQVVVILFLGARVITQGDGFSLGMLFAFLAFRQIFADSANALINQGIQFRLLGLHVERLGDIVHGPIDAMDESPLPTDIHGALKLRRVSFRYGAADRFILEDLDLEVSAGEYVAITGPSGEGKTTLLKIMLGLHGPESGSVEFDGRPVSPGLARAWRARAGVVQQDDRLLSGSLADNISFFDPDLSMARVIEAGRAANVHDEIMRMPMQYMSLVGDMGSVLSGGQKQRILLARALYRVPAILFLDEGTANLDEANEEQIAELVATLPITRVVIAHRPALLRQANRVLELHAGKLRPVDTLIGVQALDRRYDSKERLGGGA